jgi:hypothetical protein
VQRRIGEEERGEIGRWGEMERWEANGFYENQRSYRS